MPIIPRDQLRALIKEHNLKDVKLFVDTLQEMLEAELDHELGYKKYGYKNKSTGNSRNGYSSKTVRSIHGKVELMTETESLNRKLQRKTRRIFHQLRIRYCPCMPRTCLPMI